MKSKITSARIMVMTSVLTMSIVLTGCGKEVEELITTASSVAEQVNEITTDLSEKIDEIEIKIPETIAPVFDTIEEKKVYVVSDTAKGYSDLGITVAENYTANDCLTVTEISDNGLWYKSADGLYITVLDVSDKATQRVVKEEQSYQYVQRERTKAHVKPDKNSETVSILETNQMVVKTGEVQFVSADGSPTMTDSSGDHGWSEIKWKKDGETVTAYVYTDYLGTAKATEKVYAVEVPSFTEEEKSALSEWVSEINGKSTEGFTDEDYYNLLSEYQAYVKAENEKDYAERYDGSENVIRSNDWIDDVVKQVMDESKKKKQENNSSTLDPNYFSIGIPVYGTNEWHEWALSTGKTKEEIQHDDFDYSWVSDMDGQTYHGHKNVYYHWIYHYTPNNEWVVCSKCSWNEKG